MNGSLIWETTPFTAYMPLTKETARTSCGPKGSAQQPLLAHKQQLRQPSKSTARTVVHSLQIPSTGLQGDSAPRIPYLLHGCPNKHVLGTQIPAATLCRGALAHVLGGEGARDLQLVRRTNVDKNNNGPSKAVMEKNLEDPKPCS